MSNLLIGILAIALIAAISVLGANYGGSIYLEARADAQAAELVGNAAKVASAMRAWTYANGGSRTFSDTDWSDGTATDLISGSNMYLDALPKLGSYAQGNGSSDYYFKAATLSNVAWASEGVNFDTLFAVITDKSVCKAVGRLAGGTDSSTPVYRNTAGATMGDFSSNLSGYDFQCVVNDANNNSAIDSGESMFFLYKVF